MIDVWCQISKRAVLWLSVLSLSMTGCAGYRIVRTYDAAPARPAKPQITTQTQESDPQSRLSAIEEFLERTKDYHVADTMTSPVARIQAMPPRPQDTGSDMDSANATRLRPPSVPQTDHQRFAKG